jgi:hypothetical protein
MPLSSSFLTFDHRSRSPLQPFQPEYFELKMDYVILKNEDLLPKEGSASKPSPPSTTLSSPPPSGALLASNASWMWYPVRVPLLLAYRYAISVFYAVLCVPSPVPWLDVGTGAPGAAEVQSEAPGDDESASLALALKLQEEDRGAGGAATAAAPSSSVGTDDWVVVGTKKPTQETDAAGVCV